MKTQNFQTLVARLVFITLLAPYFSWTNVKAFQETGIRVVYADPLIPYENNPNAVRSVLDFKTNEFNFEAFKAKLDQLDNPSTQAYRVGLPLIISEWQQYAENFLLESDEIDRRLDAALDQIGSDFFSNEAAANWATHSIENFKILDKAYVELRLDIDRLMYLVSAGTPSTTKNRLQIIIDRSARWYQTAKGIAATTVSVELAISIANQSVQVLESLRDDLKAIESAGNQTAESLDIEPIEKQVNQITQANALYGSENLKQKQANVPDHVHDVLVQSMLAANHSQSGSQREELYGAATLVYGAELAYQEGDHVSGASLLKGALYTLDIGLGFVPVVGSVNDITQIVYGVLTGKTYTGETFTVGEFGLRALSAMLGMLGQSAWLKMGKNLRVGWDFAEGAKALRDAEKTQAISTTLTQAGKETYHELAAFLGNLYRKAPKGIEDIADAADIHAIKILQDFDGSFSSAKLAVLNNELAKTEWGSSYLRKVLKLRGENIPFNNIDEMTEYARKYNAISKQILKVEAKRVQDLTVIRMIPKSHNGLEQSAENVFKSHPGMLVGEGRYSLPGNEWVYTVVGDDLKSFQTMASELSLQTPTSMPFDAATLWPNHIWSQMRTSSNRVLDLTDEKTLLRLGVIGDDIKNVENYAIPQILGDLAKRNGFEGLLVPSVAAIKNRIADTKNYISLGGM